MTIDKDFIEVRFPELGGYPGETLIGDKATGEIRWGPASSSPFPDGIFGVASGVVSSYNGTSYTADLQFREVKLIDRLETLEKLFDDFKAQILNYNNVFRRIFEHDARHKTSEDRLVALETRKYRKDETIDEIREAERNRIENMHNLLSALNSRLVQIELAFQKKKRHVNICQKLIEDRLKALEKKCIVLRSVEDD